MQALQYSFIFCLLTASGLLVSSAVSRVSLFEADNDGNTHNLVGAR